MLKEPPPSHALSALELADRRGASPQAIALADVYIMREMLGDTSYRALLGCKTMTRAQYLKIVNRVMTRAMGALEDEDGSPNR
jgi:small-conductance mechanosensitive channel